MAPFFVWTNNLFRWRTTKINSVNFSSVWTCLTWFKKIQILQLLLSQQWTEQLSWLERGTIWLIFVYFLVWTNNVFRWKTAETNSVNFSSVWTCLIGFKKIQILQLLLPQQKQNLIFKNKRVLIFSYKEETSVVWTNNLFRWKTAETNSVNFSSIWSCLTSFKKIQILQLLLSQQRTEQFSWYLGISKRNHMAHLCIFFGLNK